MKDKEKDLGFDESYPNCNSKNIVQEIEIEDGNIEYAVSSDASECQDCRHVCRGEESYS